MRTLRLLIVLLFATVGVCSADSPDASESNSKEPKPKTVEQIVEETRDSIVVVTPGGRDGNTAGIGTGFAIDDGLIATNLHVIGEARPIWVKTHDGEQFEVTEVFASDRTLDLAIIRIDDSDKLKPLSLASDDFSQGQPAVAIGHPLGLKNTVVNGIVAGEREFNGTPMWQVAMTIEPGNSGGPLFDMQGLVHGIVSMKSAGGEAFGFAVKINQLKKLIDRPNPISIQQWQTIGQVDPNRWQATMGAQWRQRSGRLFVTGAGRGFGGRSLLLRSDEPPEVPFELAVSVKLDHESGAAGLLFHGDGDQRHYGFYPSNGRLRLTSFEGPTVYSWNVIRELETEHYKPGEWNELKVRAEEEKIVGFVNGHEVVAVDTVRLAPGRIGLCKFRHTEAEFKSFRWGQRVATETISEDRIASLIGQLQSLPARSELTDDQLSKHGDDVGEQIAALEYQARQLEREAAEKRRLGQDIHVHAACERLREISASDGDRPQIDLLLGALWIAKLDNPDLDVQTYVDMVDAMASAIRDQFKSEMTVTERLAVLDDYLFSQNAFHGSRTEYYDEANSHMDRVIDDREGLPVTLSVLYMSLAQRLGLSVVGVGLPGHFVVRHEPKDGESQLIDVFDRGARLSVDDAKRLVRQITARSPTDEDFATSPPKEILVRMLTNLHGLAQAKGDAAAMLRYTEGIVAVTPDSPRWRGLRGVLRHQQGRKQAALSDLDWILENQPPGIDLGQVRRMREAFAE